MRLSQVCLFLLFLCPILAASQGLVPQDDVESYTKVGEKIPSFTVKDLSGTEINIKEPKGKVVLINFWATWCPPCLVEMPRLEKEVWQKYKSDDFVMIAIAREQSEQEIEEFRKESGLSFPMAADPQREIYKLFGNGGIPRSYVVGLDGTILYQSIGYDSSDFNRMKKIIEKELEKARKTKASK